MRGPESPSSVEFVEIVERDQHPVRRLLDRFGAAEDHGDGRHSIERRAFREELSELLLALEERAIGLAPEPR